MSWRYRFTLLAFVFLFLLILLRLFYWQSVRADELAALGEAQYGQYIKLIPQRGEIKTSDGYAIAANKIAYIVFANPKEIKDPKVSADILAPLLQEDPASISALLSLDRYWISLKSSIDPDKKAEIEKLQLPGIGFEEKTVRYYPEASTAAKILGFVGKNNQGDDAGYFGLEGFYDRQLRGKTGIATQIHDAFGRPILAKMNDQSGEIDGRSVTLHIDRAVQYMMQAELKQGIDKYGAKSGEAAIMDPKTGGIIAMAAFPNFDPSQYQDFSNDLYLNPFISDAYEPGSTFKPLVMAAAIQEGLVKADTICSICGGPLPIGGYQIETWDNKYFPNETMNEVIQHSDNVGMSYVGKLLGLHRMVSYINKYGIDQMTNIDLQGEAAPDLRSEASWYPIDLATASFGQGISVTPIELLSAFSAIANDGKRMEPHVVSSIQTPEGDTITISPKVADQPISQQTAKVMTEMMVNAVENGESKWTKLQGYRIAGKTGTAQIPIAGHYDPNKTIASFIGFGPAENPKFLMLVIVNQPTTSIYGAETAAPIFFGIAKNLMTYYGISPTQ